MGIKIRSLTSGGYWKIKCASAILYMLIESEYQIIRTQHQGAMTKYTIISCAEPKSQNCPRWSRCPRLSEHGPWSQEGWAVRVHWPSASFYFSHGDTVIYKTIRNRSIYLVFVLFQAQSFWNSWNFLSAESNKGVTVMLLGWFCKAYRSSKDGGWSQPRLRGL